MCFFFFLEYHSQSQDTSLPLLSRPKETHYVVDEQTKADLAADNILYSREYLQNTDELIGKGEFGMVSKGYLRLPGKNEEIEVAVKTLRRRCNFFFFLILTHFWFYLFLFYS